MNSYDRIRLCTERDLCDRARNHLHTFVQYYEKAGVKAPHELDDALEWLENYRYKVGRLLYQYPEVGVCYEAQNP